MNSCDLASAKPAPSLLRRWRREPLLHVLLIGATLFVVYYALNPRAGQRQDSNHIAITADDLAQIRLAWMAQWQRPPTPEEMRNLLDGKIREEVLFREAMALGLDKDDTIVKRRLAQKMEFVMEDASALREPASDELRRWFAQNARRFAMPSLVTFRHLYFSPDRRGAHTRDDAANALNKLSSKPEETPELDGLSDRFMFQDFYAEGSPDQVANIFGTSFAQALPGLEPGKWQGPIESGLGWHLVWVESNIPGRVPAFEEIEARVKSEWNDEQRAEGKRKMFDHMRSRYQIVLPEAAPAMPGGPVAHAAAASR
ncbi:MAG: peptidylprolyl isomerase [Bradyrhizobium sp.]|jgi:peptidyl-prolyl cis-trans isomerase C|uniref:peptidylprolyl isomerase n=2 Tax=Bradyrhizobium sp. TaxID=376 RepID=UPI003BE202D2